MDVLIVTSESHRALSEGYFRASLPESAGGVVRERQLDLAGDGTVESASWQTGVTAKLGWALDYLDTVPSGTSFVLSDVDIQFFPGFTTKALSEALEQSGTNVLFQKEHTSTDSLVVNTGFYVARNTPWMRELLQQAIVECDGLEVKNDQTAVNQLLKAADLGTRWGFLPFAYYARTQGFPPRRDIVLHHANFSGTVPDKIAQLQRVRRYVGGHTVDKALATAGEGWDFVASGKLRMWLRIKLKRQRGD